MVVMLAVTFLIKIVLPDAIGEASRQAMRGPRLRHRVKRDVIMLLRPLVVLKWLVPVFAVSGRSIGIPVTGVPSVAIRSEC